MHVELLVKLLGEMRPPLDNAHYAEGVDPNQQLSANSLHGVQIIVGRIQHCYNLLMPRKKSNPRRAVVWRVRVLMAERNVRSVSELVRRMEDIGVSISIAQLGRLIDGKTQHWSQEVIEGLMTILECQVGDLWKER
jgi:DNA-binding Xre family transcriptional regulator